MDDYYEFDSPTGRYRLTDPGLEFSRQEGVGGGWSHVHETGLGRTRKEVLLCLLQSAGQVVPGTVLTALVRSKGSLHTHVSALRDFLGDAKLIYNQPSIGYAFKGCVEKHAESAAPQRPPAAAGRGIGSAKRMFVAALAIGAVVVLGWRYTRTERPAGTPSPTAAPDFDTTGSAPPCAPCAGRESAACRIETVDGVCASCDGARAAARYGAIVRGSCALAGRHEERVWLLVRPYGSDVTYPQEGPRPLRDGRFSGHVWPGTKDAGCSELFTFVVALADEHASRELVRRHAEHLAFVSALPGYSEQDARGPFVRDCVEGTGAHK